MKFPLARFLFLPLAVLAASPDALPALAPAYGELPPTFWEQHQSAIITAGFALLAFAFFFLKVMLRPASPVILPPEVVVRQALTGLQNEPEDGEILSAVSQILRHYVSDTFNLPNHQLTTAEFCAAIAGNQQIGMELAETISSFLRDCDVRRFSPAHSATAINAVGRALEIVSRAEERLRSAPVPGAATSQAPSAFANQQSHKPSDVAASGDGRAP